MHYLAKYQSPLGELLMFSDGIGLTELRFTTDRFLTEASVQKTIAPTAEAEQVFARTRAWLDAYFAGEQPDFLPPLSCKGTEFQQEVWELLAGIPYGAVTTYGELARAIAKKRGLAKMSAQAIGGAVGRNPICIIIPCHRVVGSKGDLTGYAAGIAKKAALLQLEGVNLQNSVVPMHTIAL